MRTFLLICSVFFATVDAIGQPVRAFEVASIRLYPGNGPRVGYRASGPTLVLEGYTVPDLIVEAYDLERYQLVLPAGFSKPDSPPPVYNIAAKASGTESPTRAEFREMLQEMLASRFHLKFHRESRETAVYGLVQGKNGSRLRESKPDTEAVSNHRVHGRNQTIESTQTTMEAFIRDLPLYVDRPVIDKTGLAGKYDINIEATPYFRLTNNPQAEDITMFAAVQETLGLRLEADKVALPVMVIDSVEAPTEN